MLLIITEKYLKLWFNLDQAHDSLGLLFYS